MSSPIIVKVFFFGSSFHVCCSWWASLPALCTAKRKLPTTGRSRWRSFPSCDSSWSMRSRALTRLSCTTRTPTQVRSVSLCGVLNCALNRRDRCWDLGVRWERPGERRHRALSVMKHSTRRSTFAPSSRARAVRALWCLLCDECAYWLCVSPSTLIFILIRTFIFASVRFESVFAAKRRRLKSKLSKQQPLVVLRSWSCACAWTTSRSKNPSEGKLNSISKETSNNRH